MRRVPVRVRMQSERWVRMPVPNGRGAQLPFHIRAFGGELAVFCMLTRARVRGNPLEVWGEFSDTIRSAT